jgi:hypothetical protein
MRIKEGNTQGSITVWGEGTFCEETGKKREFIYRGMSLKAHWP